MNSSLTIKVLNPPHYLLVPHVEEDDSIFPGATSSIAKERTVQEPISPEEDALYDDLQKVTNAGVVFIEPIVYDFIDPEIDNFLNISHLPTHRRPTDKELISTLYHVYKEPILLTPDSQKLAEQLLSVVTRHRTVSPWLRKWIEALYEENRGKTKTNPLEFKLQVEDKSLLVKNFLDVNLNNKEAKNQDDLELKERWKYLTESEKRWLTLLNNDLDISKLPITNLHLAIIYLENAEKRQWFDEFILDTEKNIQSSNRLSTSDLDDLVSIIEETLDTDWLDDRHREDILTQSREDKLFEVIDLLNIQDQVNLSNKLVNYIKEVSLAGDFREKLGFKLLVRATKYNTEATKILLADLNSPGIPRFNFVSREEKEKALRFFEKIAG